MQITEYTPTHAGTGLIIVSSYIRTAATAELDTKTARRVRTFGAIVFTLY